MFCVLINVLDIPKDWFICGQIDFQEGSFTLVDFELTIRDRCMKMLRKESHEPIDFKFDL